MESRKSQSRCLHLLKNFSRSYAAIIEDYGGELYDPLCIFYLILRGLDTIEDDMTLPIEEKIDLLTKFPEAIFHSGWNFTKSGPNEKDRQLLVEFDAVIEEFLILDKKYKTIIGNITEKMAKGMIIYAKKAAENTFAINTIKEYETYGHYVAGLVGIGIGEIFLAAGWLNLEMVINNKNPDNIGIFLQKVNIIGDFYEDLMSNRKYWPKEIWSKYVENISDFTLSEHQCNAVYCLSEMIYDALRNVPDFLVHFDHVHNPQVFKLCAIPFVASMAKLEYNFKNHATFIRTIKIRKGRAVQLMLETNNMKNVARILIDLMRKIHAKNDDEKDPHFHKIKTICNQIGAKIGLADNILG
ncbi:hypothetical protein G9A89_015209 [Geosiphon pyriformis]|nr:hypothetical protein G9A89_015209 [Geosiphon pyriformis]